MPAIRRAVAATAILGLLVLIVASGCGHKSSTTGAATGTPATAAARAAPQDAEPVVQAAPLGAPTGPAATGTIGPGGGTLNSADGRVSIEVPPGAVPGDVPFSIQPYNNTEANGIGPIYLLSPEGLAFAQPVTLAWHLSDADLAGHPIDAISIASRNADGDWIPQPGVERDAAAKTVRVTSAHLSPWEAYLPSLTITPDHAEVRVNKTVALKVSRYDVEEDADLLAAPSRAAPAQPSSGDSDADLLAAPHRAAPAQPPNGDEDADLLAAPMTSECRWKVNGKTGGGDAVFGYIRVDGKTSATYSAPAKVPPINPVAVSCEEVIKVKGKKAKAIAVANINVTDKKGWHVVFQYEYSSTSQTDASPATDIHEETRHVNGSFDLQADPQGLGLVGGQGTATLAQTITGTIINPMCTFKDVTSLSGPLEVDAQGAAGSGSGSLGLNVHGDNLSGKNEHSGGKCSANGPGGATSWNNASFAVSCQFVGVDFDKGGSYTSPVDLDQGHGTCKVTITPN